MATLKAMFKLFDGYSSTVDKINQKTDKVTNKILKASGATDNFNKKLENIGASANIASGGIGKLVGAFISLAAAKKGADISDEYINTNARLNLINDGLQTQAELQEKIFAAAKRSRGAYSDMASAISKMGILARDSFSSNDEMIAFTELIQKSFKIGGASSAEQSSAMLQLTQAMSAGRLQGDEFRSIMENAPMIAEAIARYTGKSKGELKEMSSEGLITSDIIKNAMFQMSDDINDKFSTMPMTFADVWNRIKNGATKSFSGVIERINTLINTDEFMRFVDAIIIGFDLVAQIVSWLITAIVEGWNIIGPILAIISGVLLVTMIANLWAMVPPLVAQAVAWLSIYWPILLIIGVIVLVLTAVRKLGVTWEQIFSVIGGIIGTFATFFYNKFVYMWNMVAAFINFFGNVFNNPIASVQTLFYNLMVNVLGFIETIAQGIQDLLNKIPGIEVDIVSSITGLKNGLAVKADEIKNEAGLVEYVKTKEFMDYSEGYTKGSEIGENIYNGVNDALNSFNNIGFDASEFGTESNPITIQGTGTNDTVEVNMADEDLQYLRDMAQREYINKFSTSTLAPNIQISFGDVHEEADADKVAGRIRKILQEEIAMAAEGSYA